MCLLINRVGYEILDNKHQNVKLFLQFTKMASKEASLRNRVHKFYEQNIDRGKSFTYRHFAAENVSKSTLYSILQRFESGVGADRKKGTGGKAVKITQQQLQKVKKVFENSDSCSLRLAARKFGVSPSYLCNILKNKTNLRFRRKQTIPKRSENQIQLAKPKCGRLMRKFSNHAFILDDESYFTLSHTTIHGNGGFYTNDVSEASPSVKFATKAKFEGKVLVWVAIGPKGLSRSLIRKSGFAINSRVYLNDCIKQRLIPYIRDNYQNDQYVFWPDLASSHYAKIVVDHLRQENIYFVEKEDNPANCPEARPIEDFWSLLKGRVYTRGWRAKNTTQLITRIKYCLKKITVDVVQRLSESTHKRIDIIRRNGVIEVR
jgi:transposase